MKKPVLLLKNKIIVKITGNMPWLKKQKSNMKRIEGFEMFKVAVESLTQACARIKHGLDLFPPFLLGRK